MYLNPQIHDTQDTLTIRVGYIGIHSRIRISSPTCGRAWIPQTPEIRVPHVSRMYSACIPHVSWLPLRIHVSRMYLACIPHVSFISDTSLSGCIWDTCISSCILDVSRMYLDHPCRYMYLACIPHPRYMYRDFVSCCILMYYLTKSPRYMYLDVSWCILLCIQCDT